MRLPTELQQNQNFASSSLNHSSLCIQMAHCLDFFSSAYKIRPISNLLYPQGYNLLAVSSVVFSGSLFSDRWIVKNLLWV